MAGDLAQSLVNPDRCNTNLLPIPRPLAITLSTRKHDTTNSRFLPPGREFSSMCRAFVCDWFTSLLSAEQKCRLGKLAMVYLNELTHLKPRTKISNVMEAMLFCCFRSSPSRLVPAWKARELSREVSMHTNCCPVRIVGLFFHVTLTPNRITNCREWRQIKSRGEKRVKGLW